MLDAIGAYLLFKYGVSGDPNTVKIGTFIVGKEKENFEKDKLDFSIKYRFAKLGFWFLMLGFLFQLAGLLLPSISKFNSKKNTQTHPESTNKNIDFFNQASSTLRKTIFFLKGVYLII